MEIQKMHDFVLDYLLEKKQTCFTLRKQPESKLAQGYWFLGDKGFLNFSFWVSKKYNIFFGYNTLDHYWLELVDKEIDDKNTTKVVFFESISSILGFRHKHTKRKGEVIWIKPYDLSLTDALNEFLTKDKPMLDTLMDEKLGEKKQQLFPPISQEAFQKNLDLVNTWRAKGIETTVKPKPRELLRLETVILENIIHFNYIQIDLNQQITCIIGENGLGKTSILKAIGLALAGIRHNTVIDVKNPMIQKMLRVEKIEGKKIVYADKGAIHIAYKDGKDRKNSIQFQNIKGDIADSKGRILRNFNQIVDKGDLLLAKNNYFANLILGFSQVKSIHDATSFQDDDDDVTPRVSEVTNLIYNLPDHAFDHFATWIVQLWSVKKNPKLRETSLQILVDIFAVIQRIVGGRFELMPMQIEQTEVFIKTTDAPNGIPLRLLSQGYNNVIGWVGRFMQRLWEVTPESEKANFKKTPAICLIDEIDTYLHPKWEQKILAVLAEEFPNTQFVVTTHSPIVLANLKDNYRIYAIAKADNGQMMAFEHQKSDFNPYGASSSEVIRRLMHVQERPEPVQKLMNAYNQAILHNDFAKATEFEAQLKQLIDPNDPEIIEGQASIEARKIIQDL